jgi:hypothetical protein
MRRKLMLPALAACALLAVSAPVASAAKTPRAHAAVSGKSFNKLAKKVGNAIAKINSLKNADKGAAGAIHGVDGRVDTVVANLAAVKATVDAIVANVPAITSALTALKDGLTAAGAGLTSLKTLATSTEYGFGQVIVISAGPTPNAQLGSFVVTPDIPDSVQQAQTEQQFVAQHSGVLAVAYGIRSFESDGTGAADPAGLCKVTVTNEAGTTETTAANAGLGGLPFQPVNLKSVPTSTVPANAGFPFGLKTTAPDADNTTTFASTVPVAAGDTYTVGLACVDTTASSSDPTA